MRLRRRRLERAEVQVPRPEVWIQRAVARQVADLANRRSSSPGRTSASPTATSPPPPMAAARGLGSCCECCGTALQRAQLGPLLPILATDTLAEPSAASQAYVAVTCQHWNQSTSGTKRNGVGGENCVVSGVLRIAGVYNGAGTSPSAALPAYSVFVRRAGGEPVGSLDRRDMQNRLSSTEQAAGLVEGAGAAVVCALRNALRFSVRNGASVVTSQRMVRTSAWWASLQSEHDR